MLIKKLILPIFFVLPVACKTRAGNDQSGTKSILAEEKDGSLELWHLPVNSSDFLSLDAGGDYTGSLAGKELAAGPVERPVSFVNSNTPENVCFSKCTKGTDQVIDGFRLPALDCHPVGYASGKDLLEVSAKLTPDGQKLALMAFSNNRKTTSPADAAYQEVKKAFLPLMKADKALTSICGQTAEKPGLSLTNLFMAPICFRNKTGYTVKIDATVTYNTTAGGYMGDHDGNWTYSPGENSCLDKSGCRNNEDGLCKLAGIKYQASINGTVFQHNGAGIEFRDSRNTTDNHYIDLNYSGGGGGGGSSSAASSGGKTYESACLAALKEVYNNYGNNAFQGSARINEVTACLGATQKTDWDNFRAHFYCQFPGKPVRECFTTGAGALKKLGWSQDNAYKSMFASCSTNGSFNSFSGNMKGNFENIMLQDYNSGNDESCINDYYSWLGKNRPVR